MEKYGINSINHLILTSTIILASCTSLTSHAAVIINEIDYDQPSTDTAEFIELFNTGATAISLENYSIELINGSNAAGYRSINLSIFNIEANGYFVVCGDATLVANCDYSFTVTNSWIQNGSPDAVGLYENSSLIDSLSYEGKLAIFTEGDALTIGDNASDIASLSRIVNGIDTNNNALDFQLSCITPGSSNIAGIGDCSVANVSPVPVPAAAWLFGSGLLGLTCVARRKKS